MAGRPRKDKPQTRQEEHQERLDRMGKVCELLADGHSLAAICSPEKREKDKSLPTRTEALRWVSQYPDIRDMYAQARDIGVEVWGDELRSISNGVLSGKIDPNAARVAADITKWTMARLAPKKWGDRVSADLNHQGQIATGPPVLNIILSGEEANGPQAAPETK